VELPGPDLPLARGEGGEHLEAVLPLVPAALVMQDPPGDEFDPLSHGVATVPGRVMKVEDELPARPQDPRRRGEKREVLLLGEVAEAHRPEEHQIEGAAQRPVAEIGPEEAHGKSLPDRGLPPQPNHVGDVHPQHPAAAPGERKGEPTPAAGQVEHLLPGGESHHAVQEV
jgi:hypothetical protein